MKIKFYLLWFENEPDWVTGKKEYVKEIVEESGFKCVEPKICRKGSEFKGKYDDYDMILVDYKLVGGSKKGQTGADIISKIRKECFSNIIFYSQHGEDRLREEIAKKGLDGVFCVHRDDFLDRFEKIFLAHIKKIEDVNNLRGLVMAETADLESLKEEIIELYDSVDCPKKKEYTKKIIDEMLNIANGQKTFFESKDEDTPIRDLLEKLDFYRKSMMIHRINKRTTPVANFIHDDFNRDIIIKRNLLAHVKESKTNDGDIILESRDKSLLFSQDEAKQIRKDISKYRIELEKIKESLKS